MYALRITGDIDTAEDVVQDSFARAWSLFSSGGNVEDFSKYIYRAVHNNALMALRDNKIASDTEIPEDVTDEAIDTSERDARLWTAIDRLPTRCREIFLMSKRDGMTYNQIAEELHLSVKTVEHQVSKALREMREAIQKTAYRIYLLFFG